MASISRHWKVLCFGGLGLVAAGMIKTCGTSFSTLTMSQVVPKNQANSAASRIMPSSDQHDLIPLFSTRPPQQLLMIPNQTDTTMTRVNRWRAAMIASNVSSPLEHCAPTTQLQLQLHYNDSSHDSMMVWILQSLDEQGQQKSVGGDEFYISYRDHDHTGGGDATAVAIPTDLGDGRYLLDFATPPMVVATHTNNDNMSLSDGSFGTLMVHVQYTCRIGRMTDPEKEDWNYGGFILGLTWHVPHVPAPPIRPFRMSTVDLSHYDAVICFGDSIMNNFCGRFWATFLYHVPNVHCAGNAGGAVALSTVEARNQQLQDWHGELLDTSHHHNATVALLLGSAAWDITEATQGSVQGRHFDDHIQACRLLIAYVRQHYPKVDIIWKSPQAMHVHVLKEGCMTNAQCRHRTKYTSSSNVHHLHRRQQALMEELGVPFIDLYEASYLSDSWMMAGDTRHYRKWLNKKMFSWSYPGLDMNKLPRFVVPK